MFREIAPISPLLSPSGKTSREGRIQRNLDPSTFITHLISDVIVLTLGEHASKQDKQGLAPGRLLSAYKRKLWAGNLLEEHFECKPRASGHSEKVLYTPKLLRLVCAVMWSYVCV